MAQLSYSQATPRGVAGGLYDIAANEVHSRMAEGTGVKHGMGVVIGTSKGTQVKKPASTDTAKTFEGFVGHTFAHEMDKDGNVVISAGETVNVVAEGNLWALLATGTTPAAGDPLYLVVDGAEAGKATNAAAITAKSYTAVALNGYFIGTKGTGDLAPVHISAAVGVSQMIADATAE